MMKANLNQVKKPNFMSLVNDIVVLQYSVITVVFFTGRQKVFAHSSGLKDFYDLKHVAFFHFVRVILLFGV